jgi:hypothetical protein
MRRSASTARAPGRLELRSRVSGFSTTPGDQRLVAELLHQEGGSRRPAAGRPGAGHAPHALGHALAAVAGVLLGRRHEAAEDRVRAQRLGLELGVELDAHEEGVVGQLDDLDQAELGVDAARHQAAGDQAVAVGVVELVAVAVAL